MQLNLTNITYTYPGAANAALANTTVTFTKGWTGIVGDNGCGKSTLACIACRQIAPDAGSISPALFAVYCEQDSTRKPDMLYDFAADWGRDAQEIRRLLEIEEDWLWRYASLSGGQQKRVQIACALWQRPDVLVMDEPTNDLDAATKRTVADALARFDGIGLLISHDKELLDELPKQCLIFEGSTFVMRPGNYTKASDQARNDHDTLVRQREDAKREKRRLEAEAARRRVEADRSKARRSKRTLDEHDSDGRERIGRAVVSGKDGIATRASATMQRRAAQAGEALAQNKIAKRYDGRFRDYGATASAKTLVHLDTTELYAGEFTLEIPELWIGPRDHIVLSGNNGCGKSLLIREIVDHVRENAKVAYVAQEVDAALRMAALERLERYDSQRRGQILSLVGSLNSDPKRLADGIDISPGELKKLLLAEQLIEDPHLLVLDEPTNHLDLGSIEALAELLADFPGAFLLVTHDRALQETVARTHWHIEREEGRCMLKIA